MTSAQIDVQDDQVGRFDPVTVERDLLLAD